MDGGIEVRCDGEVVGVIANGKDGTDGEVGSDGKGCTAEAIENGYKILCGGDSIGVLKNGEKGETGENGSGCKIADLGDGVVEVTCGEGENASTATLYKAMCGAAAYDPATQICADDSIYELCGTETYDPATQMCLDNQIVSVCSESLDGESATFWSSTVSSSTAYRCYFHYDELVHSDYDYKYNGFSVRCFRDSE
ncbi:hypothetical protein [uncultured Fibrobacter sp.]|uniref:hypothetical protein n=1 Tax=uncultured Fibrobacter sp. TaxID=261512 RepID=UPI002804C858|nr:hypothetical protein [uncultured Fibrobacter sp.]